MTHGARRQQAAPEKRVAATPPAPVKQADETDNANRPCAKGENDRDSDLCAQWKAADAAAEAASYAEPLYWLSVVGAVIGLLTAVFAGGAAWFAKRAADAARAQFAHTEISTERQLRAYLFVDTIDVMNVAETDDPPEKRSNAYRNRPETGPMAHVIVRNSGQTPGYDVVHWGCIELAPYPQSGPLVEPSPPNHVSRSIVPAGSVLPKTPMLPNALSETEIRGLQDSTLAIYIHGFIKYRDAFGTVRESRYRFRHNGLTGIIGKNTEATGCDDGNTGS